MPQFNWVLDNIEIALATWSAKLAEIWTLLTQDPATFKGGGIWDVIVDIHGALQAIGYALLVLFFLMGVIKTCGSFAELKRPEVAFKMFIRFVIAKGVITYGLELMMMLFRTVQGIINTTMDVSGVTAGEALTIPETMITAINEVPFLESIPIWAVSLLGGLVVTILSFIMILTVYGRFFKLYLFAAISPVILAAFAGEPTSDMGRNFLRSYAAVCLEGVVIVISCIIFTHFVQAPPVVQEGASATTMVWTYLTELIFNLLVLVGSIRMANRLVREMLFGG